MNVERYAFVDILCDLIAFKTDRLSGRKGTREAEKTAEFEYFST